jgi:hypothetical protein
MWLFLFTLSLSILSCSHAVVPDIDLRTDVRMRDLTAQCARTLPAPFQEPYSPPYNEPKSGSKQNKRRLRINNILPWRSFFLFWRDDHTKQHCCCVLKLVMTYAVGVSGPDFRLIHPHLQPPGSNIRSSPRTRQVFLYSIVIAHLYISGRYQNPLLLHRGDQLQQHIRSRPPLLQTNSMNASRRPIFSPDRLNHYSGTPSGHSLSRKAQHGKAHISAISCGIHLKLDSSNTATMKRCRIYVCLVIQRVCSCHFSLVLSLEIDSGQILVISVSMAFSRSSSAP